MAKIQQTGAMQTNKDEYFKKGFDPGLDVDQGSRQYQDPSSIQLQDGYSFVAHQDAPDAVAFTQSKKSRKGGGFDYGEKRMIYKKVEQKQAPAQQAPAPEPEAPEPEKDKGPVELSPEVAQAKERVNNWKGSIDGTAGSTFNTNAPTETPEPDAMPNSVSFSPAETNTPAYKPNDGNAEQAQNFADKYKLNLLNKGAGQSDFSAV